MFGVAGRIVTVLAIIQGFAPPLPALANIIPNNEIPFQQQIARELERNTNMGMYGFKGITREVIPATPITDCIFMTSQSGRFVYETVAASEAVCGIYVFTEPDEIVELSFPHLDVPCGGKDLIGVVDGWELNRQYFPSIIDHPLPLEQRSTEFCGHKSPKIFSSSQNVALIQYRIPTVGKGFTISIKFRKNIQPCHVVASSDTEPFTLRNYGRRVNCTFMAIYPAAVRIVALDVGSKRVKTAAAVAAGLSETETGTIHQCDKRGSEDIVQIGGTNGLDTSQLEIADTICGIVSKQEANSKIIGCNVTTVRLVSSGRYDNSVTITAQPADDNQVLDADLTCGLNDIKSSELIDHISSIMFSTSG